MSGTLQASVVKDGASATNNLAMDASGNVTVGNNLTVTGTGILNIGSGQIYKDASGNVGIGTSAPTAKVQIYTNGAPAASGNMTTGMAIAAGPGSYAINIGADATAGYTWLNSAYINSSNTASPMVFMTGASERMRIDSSGNLLVGYTSSNGSYKLQVNSQIFATSSTIATSDANYKTNVMPLSGALDIVQKLNPVSFSWKKHAVHNFDTATPTVGFLAQEVQTALSSQTYVNSIVKESEVTLPDETKEKFLGIAEGNMIALLTKAIQELSAKNDALEARLLQLEVK